MWLQRDLEKLRELANRNFLNFSSEICKVLRGGVHMWQENPLHQSRLEISWLSSNPGKDLGVTAGAALSMVQSVLSPQRRQIASWATLGAVRRVDQRNLLSPLFNAREVTSGYCEQNP